MQQQGLLARELWGVARSPGAEERVTSRPEWNCGVSRWLAVCLMALARPASPLPSQLPLLTRSPFTHRPADPMPHPPSYPRSHRKVDLSLPTSALPVAAQAGDEHGQGQREAQDGALGVLQVRGCAQVLLA